MMYPLPGFQLARLIYYKFHVVSSLWREVSKIKIDLDQAFA